MIDRHTFSGWIGTGLQITRVQGVSGPGTQTGKGHLSGMYLCKYG